MGLTQHSFHVLNCFVGHLGGYEGRTMLELGSQQVYSIPNVPEASAAKSFFEQLGVRHTSVDLNGELGALQLDLSLPINKPEWINHFDIVTDYGTTEHVGMGLDRLYACRANCHNFCRPGGIMVFVNPKTGHWPKHGYHYFTKEHYIKLAAANQYGVLEIGEHPAMNNYVDGWQVYAVLTKTSAVPMVPFDQFVDLCQGTVFTA